MLSRCLLIKTAWVRKGLLGQGHDTNKKRAKIREVTGNQARRLMWSNPVQGFVAEASSLQTAHKKALEICPGPGTDQLLVFLVSG
jgi:hypothetical protein